MRDRTFSDKSGPFPTTQRPDVRPVVKEYFLHVDRAEGIEGAEGRSRGV